MFLYSAFCLLIGIGSVVRGAEPQTSDSLRIISLSPNITETIFALGFGDRVVGDSDYCKYPPEAEKRPHVGGLYNTNVELIIALNPSLVFHSVAQSNGIDHIKAAGIPLVRIPSDSLDDVTAGIEKVGRTLGANDRATSITLGIRRDLEALRLVNEKRGKRSRVLQVIDRPAGALRDIYVVGSHNFMDDMLTIAGAENVMKDSPAAYPIVSKEFLIAHPPDVIIDVRLDDEVGSRRDWLDLLGRDETNGPRIVFSRSAEFVIPGPRIAESARKLSLLIYGDEKP